MQTALQICDATFVLLFPFFLFLSREFPIDDADARDASWHKRELKPATGDSSSSDSGSIIVGGRSDGGGSGRERGRREAAARASRSNALGACE